MTPPISTLALWRSFRRILALLVLLALIGLATGTAVVVQAGRSDQPVADAALVMLDDTGAPARVDRARQLYSEGKISRILLAGRDIEAGRATLQGRGVKEEAIVGLQAPDQLAQLTAAQATLVQDNLSTALLIAEPIETLRLLKIARDHDLRLLSVPVGTSSEITISGIPREVGRYFGYVLLNR